MTKKGSLLSIKAVVDILYDLESAFQDAEGWILTLSVYPTVGKSLLETMIAENGLKLDKQNMDEVLTRMAQLLVDEYHVADHITLTFKDQETVYIDIANCVLLPVEHRLLQKNIEPFCCPFKNMIATAMDKMATDRTYEGFTESLFSKVKQDRCEHGLNLFRLKRDKTLKEVIKGMPFEKTLNI